MNDYEKARTSRTFVLSRDEAADFGWDETQHVLGSYSPYGSRIIPTRELLANGEYYYGFVETYEPQLEVTDPWEPPIELDVVGFVM